MPAAVVPVLTDAAAVLAVVAALVVAATAIAKSPLGRVLGWVYRRLFGEPLTQKLESVVARCITPQLQRVEEKNDLQHAENKAAIVDLSAKTHKLSEQLHDHRLETRDELHEIRQAAKQNQALLVQHFNEATARDQRIAALEAKRHLPGGPHEGNPT